MEKELMHALEYYKEIDANPVMADKIQNLIEMLDTLEIIQILLDSAKIKISSHYK